MSTKPVTLADHKSKKKPVIRKVWIAGDDEIAEKHNIALQKCNTLKGLHRARPEDKEIANDLYQAEKALKEAETELRATALLFKFRSIGRVAFEKLVKQHGPKEEDFEEARKDGVEPTQVNWHTATFSVALTAACSLEPKMTVAEVQELFDDEAWTEVENSALFNAALGANLERRAINLDAVGNGSSGTNGSS